MLYSRRKYVVVATTKVGIFKQITTLWCDTAAQRQLLLLPQRQEFSSKSQLRYSVTPCLIVVVATTKVGIFKQITTWRGGQPLHCLLLLLPQRQEFSSKSQLKNTRLPSLYRCCCYHKGRNFQANHNVIIQGQFPELVVVATTKVGIFKQITTFKRLTCLSLLLLLLPQRQEFSSKSQRLPLDHSPLGCCCCYHKGRNFQANHNSPVSGFDFKRVVVATTKVGIFKQITTIPTVRNAMYLLLLLPQRQEFSSKSQR